MRKNNLLLVALFLLVAAAATAQTTKEEMKRDIFRTGSNYFAYPGPKQQQLTPAPEGYEPFYIFHYGRHGSRYMSDNKYYVTAINMLDSAKNEGLLSDKGKESTLLACTSECIGKTQPADVQQHDREEHRQHIQRPTMAFEMLAAKQIHNKRYYRTHHQRPEHSPLTPHVALLGVGIKLLKRMVEAVDLSNAENAGND